MNKINLEIIKTKIFYFTPIISGIFFYIIINLINIIFFKLNLLSSIYIISDIIFFVFISYILFLFSKKINIFLIIQFIILLTIQVSDSIKTAFFGAPIIMDDVFSAKEAIIAIWMINPIFVVLIIIALSIIVLVLILNFKFRKSGLVLFIILMLFIISLNIFSKQYDSIINKADV